MPTLWTKFRIDEKGSSLRLAQLCVKRSQDCKIDIEVNAGCTGSDDIFNEAVGIISASANRIQSLIVVVATVKQRELFERVSSLHMPELVRFDHTEELASMEDRSGPRVLPATPQLKKFTLRDCILPTEPVVSFQTLTTLRLQGMLDDPVDKRPLVPFPSILAVLGMAPMLRNVHIEGCRVFCPNEPSNKVSCPNLQTLLVAKSASRFFPEFLAHLVLPKLEKIHYSPRIFSDSAGDWTLDHDRSFPTVTTLCVIPRVLSGDDADGYISEMAVGFPLMFPNARHLVVGEDGDRLLEKWANMMRSGERVPFPEMEKLTFGETPGQTDSNLNTLHNFAIARRKCGLTRVRLRMKENLTEDEMGFESAS